MHYTLTHSLSCSRSIGVSNFSEQHLQELLAGDGGCTVRPHINQLENHPALQQLKLVEYCQAEGIAVAAYSPIAGEEGGRGESMFGAIRNNAKCSPVAA